MAHLPSHPSTAARAAAARYPFDIRNMAEGTIDWAQTVGTRRCYHACQRIMPHIVPVHVARAVFNTIGQNGVVGIRATDIGGAGPRRGGIVGNAEMQ